MMMLICA